MRAHYKVGDMVIIIAGECSHAQEHIGEVHIITMGPLRGVGPHGDVEIRYGFEFTEEVDLIIFAYHHMSYGAHELKPYDPGHEKTKWEECEWQPALTVTQEE